MEYLLFSGYLVLFSWLITRIRFFRSSGLSNTQLIIVFLMKIMAGIIYGWIGIYYGQYANMLDTWGYHYASLSETNLLMNDPARFFGSIFEASHYPKGFGGVLDSHNSFWNDLKSNMFTKMLGVFGVFSKGNYYINIIFYSFITLFGPIAFYRLMIDHFPGKKIQVLLSIFLVPSFIYWTSGIHKDGITFLAISLLVYQFYFGLKEKKFNPGRIGMMLLSLLILLIFRNFILILIIPAFTAWYFADKYPGKTAVSFILTYSICLVLFFGFRYITPSLDFPQAVINKQEAFMKLEGGSSIQMNELTPNPLSFIKNTPQAIFATILRPHPGDVRHLLSLAAASETNFIILLFLCFLVWKMNYSHDSRFIWFCIFFSFSFLLTIGLTVNFLGAIVRYRSIIFPFLLVPMVCMTNWNRISTILLFNIKNKNNI